MGCIHVVLCCVVLCCEVERREERGMNEREGGREGGNVIDRVDWLG